MKTLKSFTKDQPLPNKVVEWLRFRSLAVLAVPRKRDGDAMDKYEFEARRLRMREDEGGRRRRKTKDEEGD